MGALFGVNISIFFGKYSGVSIWGHQKNNKKQWLFRKIEQKVLWISDFVILFIAPWHPSQPGEAVPLPYPPFATVWWIFKTKLVTKHCHVVTVEYILVPTRQVYMNDRPFNVVPSDVDTHVEPSNSRYSDYSCQPVLVRHGKPNKKYRHTVCQAKSR